MTGLIVVLGGVVAAVLGAAVLAVPSETSSAFSATADKTGIRSRRFTPGVVRFTAIIFIVAGVVMAIIGIGMASAGR